MNTLLRIPLFAAAGWLAGEIMARTVLATPAVTPSRVPPLDERVERRSEWREYLSSHAAPFSTLTAAQIAADPLAREKPEGVLAMSQRFTDASPEEFSALTDAIAAIKDVRLRRQAAEVLFATWAEKDPLAAIAAVSTHPSISMVALQGTLRTWAERDPRALIAWLHRTSESGGWTRVQAELTALPFLIARVPEETMAMAVALRPRRHVVGTAFIEWRSRDKAAAEAWSASAPQEVQEQIAEALRDAERGPFGAAR